MRQILSFVTSIINQLMCWYTKIWKMASKPISSIVSTVSGVQFVKFPCLSSDVPCFSMCACIKIQIIPSIDLPNWVSINHNPSCSAGRRINDVMTPNNKLSIKPQLYRSNPFNLCAARIARRGGLIKYFVFAFPTDPSKYADKRRLLLTKWNACACHAMEKQNNESPISSHLPFTHIPHQ